MSGGRNCYTFHSRSRVIVFTDNFVEVYQCNRKDKEMVLQPLVHLISALFLSTPSLHLPLHIFSLYLLSSLSSALAKVEGVCEIFIFSQRHLQNIC